MPTKTTSKLPAKTSRRRPARKTAAPLRVRASSPRRPVQDRALSRTPATSSLTEAESAVFASMPHVSSVEGRSSFSEIVSRVRFGADPVVVGRRGKPFAVLVSPEYFARLRAIEDYVDGLAADAALEDFKKSGAKAIVLADGRRRLKK